MYIANWFPRLLLISSLTSLSLIAGCGSEEDAGQNADDSFVVVSEDNDANQITVPVNSDDEIQESTPLQPVPNPPPVAAPNRPAPVNTPPSVISLLANRLGEPVPTTESSVETLQKFITVLNEQPQLAQSQQQLQQLLQIISPEVIKLCDMLLAKDNLSQTERLFTFNAKYTALTQSLQLGDRKALAMLGQLTATMSADDDELVSKNGRLLALQTATQKRLMDAQGAGQITTAISAISKDVEPWLQGYTEDQEVFAVLQGIGLRILQMDPEQGSSLLQSIAQAFQNSEDESIALEAKATMEQPAIDDSAIYPAASNYVNAPNSDENKTALLVAIDKVLSNPEKGLGTFRSLLDIVQRIEDAEVALLVIDKTSAAFSDLENAELTSEAKQQLDNLLGQIIVEQLGIIDKFRALLTSPSDETKVAVVTVYREMVEHPRMNATLLLSMMPLVEQIADADKEVTAQIQELSIQAADKLLDDEQKGFLTESLTKIINRVNLPGSTMALPTRTLQGEQFDWASLKGNYVVVDFWATWCGPCLAAIPEIASLQQLYADKNLKFLGYSIDADRAQLKTFLADREANDQALKWPVVIDDFDIDPTELEQGNAVDLSWKMPSTVYCGIQGIPTMIILDPEGQVITTIQGVQALPAELDKIFNQEGQPSETPDETPDEPGASENSRYLPVPPRFQFAAKAALQSFAGQTGNNPEPESDLLKGNPYLAPMDLDKLEIIDYLFDMQDKVSTIRQRPGFAEAVLNASKRLLAMEASDKFHVIAAEAACGILHEQAGLGNEKMDELLVQFVNSLEADSREKIKTLVKFHQAERRVLAVNDLEWPEIAIILNDTHTYLEKETLKEKHLRMAIAVVHAVNQSDEFEVRAEQYQRFGKLFAGSGFKRLANYGKSIIQAASSGPDASELVGKDMEIEGLTDFGQRIDWQAYRGKVVLIDFWATWCGPCRAEIPNIKAIHKEFPRTVFDIVAINLDREEGALAAFLKENPLPWTNVIGNDASNVAKKYSITAFPTMMAIGPDGKILAVAHRVEALKPAIEKAIRELP